MRYWLWTVAACLMAIVGQGVVATAQNPPGSLLKGLAPMPAQPGEETWTFVEDLKKPMWSDHGWKPREAASGEADLRKGVRVDTRFPDDEGLLKTAYADFSAFLAAGKTPEGGPYTIEIAKAETPVFEAFRIEVTADRCRILAADTEGIRRGLFCVEDMMLRAERPYLPLGTVERKPFIKARISRCFFGPINRPPKFRDELIDDVDYYPDHYLNRMAHDGVNGLWLTANFKDVCKTSIVPEFGDRVERRLAKLRKTVEKCRRHGIRVYLFAIEPAAWKPGDPALKRHPELGGDVVSWANQQMVCPWSEATQKHLYEATHGVFSAVPHLGGLINITHGECLTTCQSVIAPTDNRRPPCPRCGKKEPWESIAQTLLPMAKGMHDANPEAELIAWFYMPDVGEFADWVFDIAKHFPKEVTLQFNFESGVKKEFFGKGREGSDYWISTPGPSARFERIANLTRRAGAPVAAKIQTGCSHEVATAPFVPVPGLLYQKFRAMHELGVSRVMLCWYFGNYPGVMNKAAGRLSFEPFPDTEDEFLRELAGAQWGKHGDQVARAWRLFAEGYAQFPLTTHFQYWGPMHDGVVWPLLAIPRDAPLAPTWLLAPHDARHRFSPSGDRIGEALGMAYTLPEAVELCRIMSDRWNQGLAILDGVAADPDLSAERRLDIGVAKALGIQFRAGENILRFYDLRERMAREKPAEQLATLREMRLIVEAELKAGETLIGLCERDSRLGFHSEAEGYKYFPEKIRWRMYQLRELLDKEMPEIQKGIERGDDVFAAYAGRAPVGPTARSHYLADAADLVKRPADALPKDLDWQSCSQPPQAKPTGPEARWAICHDREAMYLLADCSSPDAKAAEKSSVVLTVEPRRMWPSHDFTISAGGGASAWPALDVEGGARPAKQGWQGWLRIPFAALGIDPTNPDRLRINVRLATSGGGERAWIVRHPWDPRLLINGNNPADLGWLFFEKK